jgi:hypothetical protein
MVLTTVRTWLNSGAPAIWCSTLGRDARIRVPSPAASTMVRQVLIRRKPRSDSAKFRVSDSADIRMLPSPSQSVSVESETRSDTIRMFLRSCLWGGGAILAIAGTMAMAQTELGAQRAAAALANIFGGPARTESANTQQNLSVEITDWSNAFDKELRRQADLLRAAANERREFVDKYNALQRRLDEVSSLMTRTAARLEDEAGAAQQTALAASTVAASAMKLAQAKPDRPDSAAMTPPAATPVRQAMPQMAPNALPSQSMASSATGPDAAPEEEPPYTGTLPLPAVSAAIPSQANSGSMITRALTGQMPRFASAAGGGDTIPLPPPRPPAASPPPSAEEKLVFPSNPLMRTGVLDKPPTPGATTEFALDLGATATVEAARGRWNDLRVGAAPLLDNLKPLIALKEGGKSGQELHLIAGPLTSNVATKRLCAVLNGTGLTCRPTLFEGQRLKPE